MGVPAFFRYMSERYPKIIEHLIEDRGAKDLAQPLPQFDSHNYEYDNLYIDMNGIIHPCAHPEDRPAPTSEFEMYQNVTTYVDRLFAAIRPKKLLYLAIDGVAPRAKMNQQRSRRFRAAQDAAERNAIMHDIKKELGVYDEEEGVERSGGEWDSNVITPGTEFMHRLSDYLRWYVTDRINRGGSAWQNCLVILSDASEPGEGEHKIMNYIRRQRTQDGYNPNLRHVLHGLDADLIMLGLALHEAHFTVLREEVKFGREKYSQSQAQTEQETWDTLKGNGGILAVSEDARWCYEKPFVMCRISVLREYLAVEFGGLAQPGILPFEFDFERVVDDFVFLCFFVGNDFLPHLPTLDIRDGAVDFLFNVYKRVLPTLGDYLTSEGGVVNLENVDIILAEVGAIEDEVFRRRKSADDADRVRSAQRNAQSRLGIVGGSNGLERLAMIASGEAANAVPASKPKREKESHVELETTHELDSKNQSAAAALRASLLGGASRAQPAPAPPPRPLNTGGGDTQVYGGDANVGEEGGNRFEGDVALVKVERSKEEKDAEKARVEEVYKAKSQATLDEYKANIQDEIRFWQAGWKDRYYADKYKEKDIAAGGGRERVFREYIRGLCWVMAYYYDGCASWKWYYPFHYAPFASDLRNIENYAPDFGSGGPGSDEPFRPLEQLMAVLPKESHAALPRSCHNLMLDKHSPIADFYPEEVEIDPNGKAMPWLWVSLLPFIDEERLLLHLNAASKDFDEDAKDRNRFRTATIFVHATHRPLAQVVSQAQQQALAVDSKLLLPAPSADKADVTAAGGLKRSQPCVKSVLDCATTGVGGSVVVPAQNEDPHGLACHVRSVGDLITAPLLPRGRYSDIKDNRALSLSFLDPPKHVHKSELLIGAVLPEPKLTPYDMTIRVPRLNRGMNIGDLGGGGNSGGSGGCGGGGQSFFGNGGGRGKGGKGGKGGAGAGMRGCDGGDGFSSGRGRGPPPSSYSNSGSQIHHHHFQQEYYSHQGQMPSQTRQTRDFGSYQAQQHNTLSGPRFQATAGMMNYGNSFNQFHATPPPRPPPPSIYAPSGMPLSANDQAIKRQRLEQMPSYASLPFQGHHPPSGFHGSSYQHAPASGPPRGAPFPPAGAAPHSFGHPIGAPMPLDHLRAGLAQTLARRDPSGFQHHRH